MGGELQPAGPVEGPRACRASARWTSTPPRRRPRRRRRADPSARLRSVQLVADREVGARRGRRPPPRRSSVRDSARVRPRSGSARPLRRWPRNVQVGRPGHQQVVAAGVETPHHVAAGHGRHRRQLSRDDLVLQLGILVVVRRHDLDTASSGGSSARPVASDSFCTSGRVAPTPATSVHTIRTLTTTATSGAGWARARLTVERSRHRCCPTPRAPVRLEIPRDYVTGSERPGSRRAEIVVRSLLAPRRRGQDPMVWPLERRFSQASTTRAAMPASAALPQARGS